MKKHLVRVFAGSLLAAAVHAAWAAEPVAPPDPADAIVRFDIARFDVSGATLLAPAEVDAVVRPFAGSGRDFGHVQQALEALEAAYQARGHGMVKVHLPEQELNGGVVRLVVRETRIGSVTVVGNRHVDAANVRASLPGLREGATPNLDAISSSLRLANENPAKRVQLKLQGGAAEDTVDARLEVTDASPWRVAANLDNSGSGPTGKTYAGVVLQHANLFGRDHVASVQYTTTLEEPSKVAVWGAGYHIPLYALGDSIDLYASHSNIDSGSVSAGLFNLNVSGRGSVAGARYNQILARREGHPMTDARLIYGLDIKAFKNQVLFAGENFGNDVTVRPLSIGLALGMPVGAAQANLSVTLLRNLAGGTRGSAADFARARNGAKANYTVLRFAGAYTRALAGDWQTRLLGSGQLTGDALVPGEQFGAGGAATVRGVDERTLSADSGALLNAELYTPPLCGSGRWTCRVVGFVDAAHGRRHHALPGEPARASLASAGIGLRLMFGQSLNLQADFGQVLNDGGIAGAGKNKLHVRAGLSY